MNRLPRSASLVLLLALAASALAHDHTRPQAERRRAQALALAQRQAEAAPDLAGQTPVCRLTVELRVGEAPRPVAGLLRVTNLATGKAIAFSREIHRDQNWHAVESGTTLAVPPTKLRVEAFHGLTTELTTREIDLTGQETHSLKVSLKPFYDPAAQGLRSGNTHLHLMRMTHAEAERYLRVVPQADGLDLVFLSYLRRVPDEREYISNAFTEGDLGRLSRHGVLFGNGEEHRHNFGPGGEGFGHVMFLNILKLIQPVSIGPGIMKEGTDGLPLQRGVRAARQDGAAVIWCHNKFGHEDIPNWVAGLVDAQNIFDGGTHGGYEDTFYRYLNLGMKVPFSTGTDWFIYDFSRVYVPHAGELTARSWLAELAEGKSYITNGVFLKFQANGQNVGDTIDAAPGEVVRIRGRALGRNDFRRLELIHNGRVVHAEASEPSANHFAASLEFRLEAAEPGWIALRIPEDAGQNEFGKPLFAHTSPIYLRVQGKNIFRPEIARGLIAEMEQSLKAIESQAKFADADEKEAVYRVYREAIAALQRRTADSR